MPIKYVGFPAKADPPILSVAIWAMLPLGLLLTAAGHRMSRGQWKGVSRQVHAQLAMSGLAFAAITFRDTLAGAHVRLYPAGILLCISVLLMASRLVMKFVARERYPWEQNW